MNPGDSINPYWFQIYCSAYGVLFMILLGVHFYFSRKRRLENEQWRKICAAWDAKWRAKDAASGETAG